MPLFALGFGIAVSWPPFIAGAAAGCLMQNKDKRFDLPTQTITPEIQKDLRLLKLRSAIDLKRHYKKGDSKSKTLPSISWKERKGTIATELLSDCTLADYRKRKVREIEEKNQPGGNEKWKIKGQQSQKRAKQRRH
ncbi:hypothetical protein CMV_027200 [Castanea mollissima]|uniref:Fcf2 pre-rRNA processing C-terminal domain-containing protein n=1 Tax=Castanea mollissima TaxID=60419 RepID=A0A8J4QII2_9ROSI|nr:hypothetical protein CMV_027200 [Castanea mollissima]